MVDVTTPTAVRLNLGGGDVQIPGFVNIDRKTGGEVYPLAYADGSVDEIRASHVLEHFSHLKVVDVLKDWVRALKPGGRMRVAVPNFEWVCQKYMAGEQINVEGFVMGGHVDDDDRHGVVFDKDLLTAVFKTVGLENVTPWISELQDCASLPVSLNLQGYKPQQGTAPVAADKPAEPTIQITAEERQRGPSIDLCRKYLGCGVVGAMTIPRFGPLLNMWCAIEASFPFAMPMERTEGVYWTQGMQNAFELHMDADYVIGIDYDSVYTSKDVYELVRLMQGNQGIDALCSCQIRRESQFPLFTLKDDNGNPITKLAPAHLERELLPLTKGTAHFGLTIVRVSALKRMSKPWFLGVPSKDGEWHRDDDHTDADVYFWKKWGDTGNTLFQANRVKIGHLEFDITWPDSNMRPIRQKVCDFRAMGKPVEAAS